MDTSVKRTGTKTVLTTKSALKSAETPSIDGFAIGKYRLRPFLASRGMIPGVASPTKMERACAAGNSTDTRGDGDWRRAVVRISFSLRERFSVGTALESGDLTGSTEPAAANSSGVPLAGRYPRNRFASSRRGNDIPCSVLSTTGVLTVTSHCLDLLFTVPFGYWATVLEHP